MDKLQIPSWAKKEGGAKGADSDILKLNNNNSNNNNILDYKYFWNVIIYNIFYL